MPLLQKLHLFKSPHGRKTSASQSTDDETYPPLPILARPQSAMDSPRQQLDLDVRARGNLTTRSVQYERNIPTPTPPAPRLDFLGSAVSYHPELPRVLFPAPPSSMEAFAKGDLPDPNTLPSITPRPRQASLLKTLAHHSSLSALRTKRSRAKSVAKAAAAAASAKTGRESRNEGDAPSIAPQDAGRTLKKQESQTGMTGIFRKRSLKGIRSLPRDIRLSQDSDKFRKLSNPPLLTLRSRLYASAASHQGEMPQLPADMQTFEAEAHGGPHRPDYSSPEPVNVAMRFEFQMSTPPRPRSGSEDISPRRNAMGNLKHLSSPAGSIAHLSSSPQRLMSKAELRAVKGSPPKQEKRYGSISYGSPKLGGASPFGVDLESVESDDRRHCTVDEALAILHASEPLPSGTPGVSQDQLRRGALVDGTSVQSGGLRFFSRDMIRSRPHNRMSDPVTAIGRIDTGRSGSDGSQDSGSSGENRRHRSASPYEVALTPDVTKRMSLDAFGTPSPVKQWLGSDDADRDSRSPPDQEWLEDDVPDIFDFVDQRRPRSQSMPDFEATQLTPIEERSDVGTSSRQVSPAASVWREGAETPSHLGCYSRHSRIQSTTSFQTGSSGIPPVPALPIELVAVCSAPRALKSRRHASAPPQESIRMVQGDIGQDQEAVIEIQRVQIDSLRRTLMGMATGVRGADDYLSAGSQHALGARDDLIAKLQTAMSENEDFCEKLQDAHDVMADRCALLEERNAALLSKHEELSLRTPSPNPATELRLKVLERANAELIRELATAKGEGFDRQKKVAQLESRHEDAEQAISRLRSELAQAKEAAKAAKKEKEESDAQAEATSDDLAQLVKTHQDEGKALQVQLIAKDEIICRLRKRLASARFEVDEKVVRLQRDIEALRIERDGAQDMAEARRTRSDAATKEKQGMQDDLDRAQRQYAQLEADFHSIIADGEAMQHELQEERRNKDLYKSDVADLMEDIQDLEKEMEGRDRELKEERAEKEGLMNMVQKAEEQLSDERSRWEEEKQNLLDMLAGMNSNESQEFAETRDLADQLTIRLSEAEDQAEQLAAEVADLQQRLEIQQQSLAMQDDQLEVMKQDLALCEDIHARSIEESERQRKDAERAITRLRAEVQELQDHIALQEEALRSAVGEREMEKSRSGDVRSRLDAYLTEIDKLKVSEAKLSAQLEDSHKRSAADEIARAELEKKLEQAKEDKEMLDVALDSKQTELSLLQRQLGQSVRSATSAPSPTKLRTTIVGTPRALRTTAASVDTPVAHETATKDLATASAAAVAGSAVKLRREASVHGPSTTPRAVLARRAVLGSTTRHNQTSVADTTPTKSIAMRPGKAGPTTPIGIARAGVPGVKKQSSLPVLVRPLHGHQESR